MARDKSRTKQSSTLKKDFDAEFSAGNKDQPDVPHTQESTVEGNSNNEDSFDSNYDEDISMKKQVSVKVYYSTPEKRGPRKPPDPFYTARENPNGFYMKKGDGSSDEEEQPKRKREDAGNDISDTNDSGDNGDYG